MKLSKLLLLAVFFLSATLSCKKKENEVVKEKVKLYVIADPGPSYLPAVPLVLKLSGTNVETKEVKSMHIMEYEFNKGEMQTLNLKVVSGKIYTAMTLEVATTLYQSEKHRIAYKASANEDISLTFTP